MNRGRSKALPTRSPALTTASELMTTWETPVPAAAKVVPLAFRSPPALATICAVVVPVRKLATLLRVTVSLVPKLRTPLSVSVTDEGDVGLAIWTLTLGPTARLAPVPTVKLLPNT